MFLRGESQAVNRGWDENAAAGPSQMIDGAFGRGGGSVGGGLSPLTDLSPDRLKYGGVSCRLATGEPSTNPMRPDRRGNKPGYQAT